MTGAAWTLGGIVILLAGLWPLRSLLRRPRLRDRDEARSLLSQLTTVLDAAQDLPADARAEAERYLLLAGAALGGNPGPDDCRRSIDWSRNGLTLVAER